jgi:hypothetical protein
MVQASTGGSPPGGTGVPSAPDAGGPTDGGEEPGDSRGADGASDAEGAAGDAVANVDARPTTGDGGCSGDGGVCPLPNLARGGTVTSSNPYVPPEDMTKAFDGQVATKWYAGNGVRTGWIAYDFAGATSHTVTSYAITSANDFPPRDPMNWQLDGSNDGTNWTLVDARMAQVFADRFQPNHYTCATSGAYQRYRLNVTANNGGTDLQLAELQLFGD